MVCRDAIAALHVGDRMLIVPIATSVAPYFALVVHDPHQAVKHAKTWWEQLPIVVGGFFQHGSQIVVTADANATSPVASSVALGSFGVSVKSPTTGC